MPENILYIILLAAGASFVQRTTGFGFGIFIMTVLPFLMPSYAEAVTLSGILSLTSSTVVMLKYLKYVSWKRILPILAAFLVMSALAVFMLEKIEGRTMRIILGLILILLSLYFCLHRLSYHLPLLYSNASSTGIVTRLSSVEILTTPAP